MKALHLICCLVVGSLLLGCASTSSDNVPNTNRKGVGISGYPEDEIRRSLILHVADHEYELFDSDRRTLDFDKPASKWTAVRYGSFVSPETFVRMKVIIMEVGPDDYWVGFESAVVTERGTGFERRQPLKGAKSKEMQDLLEGWKSELLGS